MIIFERHRPFHTLVNVLVLDLIEKLTVLCN